MSKKKILYVSQEIMPYVGETEISRISRVLPQNIQDKGYEIRLFMPRFGSINERRNQLHEVLRLSGANFMIGKDEHSLTIKVATISSARMQVYFIDNEEFFLRKNQYSDDEGVLYKDNDERMIFFAHGALETVKKLAWAPDLIHCHGWFSMVTPLFVKKAYHADPIYSSSKIVVSIYDQDFTCALDAGFAKKIKFPGLRSKDLSYLATPTYVNLMKFAIAHADGVIIGSETIHPELAQHIQDIKIPTLPYCKPEEQIEVYTKFYHEIIKKNEKK
jgi:starch synthase